ncbi:uncharacterized protein fsbp isoform X1 [Denticeps clupeoides]|uniref:uncharacterized protein fsbp isoform X1 n=1 Tax=Denticeps clupeoides TaxID=299321 RepID=UPI0010A3D4B2|nr:uncharacterized protein LOC114776354 isoform X1 [Denticeps clupeoides]
MIDPPTLTNAPRPHAAMLFPPMSNRTPNFTLEQKLYLLQQMQGVVDTVQDFRKDTNTTVQRNAVWERLAQSFNAAFPHRPPSSTGSLKTLWKRLKVECRTALYKRQEQLAAGLPLAALTQVQREVTALVPNLISHQDELDGDAGYGAGRTASPITVAGTTGTSGSDQEEADHNDVPSLPHRSGSEVGLGFLLWSLGLCRMKTARSRWPSTWVWPRPATSATCTPAPTRPPAPARARRPCSTPASRPRRRGSRARRGRSCGAWPGCASAARGRSRTAPGACWPCRSACGRPSGAPRARRRRRRAPRSTITEPNSNGWGPRGPR